MVTKNEYFITQMKLRELREQRSRLQRVYNQLRQKVALERDESGRLRVLYEGLRQVAIANQKLHPDVANLEPLLKDVNGEPISMETIIFWRERLEKELASGQLRSEIVYLFGALLEEWASEGSESTLAQSQREQIQAELVERLQQPVETGAFAALLDSLFADFALSDQNERAKQFQKAVGDSLHQRLQPSELATLLQRLSGSPHHSVAIRRQAQSFFADHIMQKELADALTIMLEHQEEWQRSEEGLAPRMLWTLNKWRLCIDEDLPTLCFLEVLGQRWLSIFQNFFGSERAVRLKQIQSQSLSPQALRIAQMLSSTNQGLRASTLTEIDIWEPVMAPEEQIAASSVKDLRQWKYGSIIEQRMRMKSKLYDIEKLSTYSALESASGMEKALMLINAEIELARAAPSSTPLHILKIDFKDFYPSLSHQILLEILQRYGISPSQRTFFETFLRVPLQLNGQIVRSGRGVPNYHQLSDLLSELVQGLFEQYVQREARVQIFRLVDDICLLATSADEMARAWHAVQVFCEAFGLAFNEEKCGSACIGGERLSILPGAQPGWLLLTLDQQGHWNVNWDALETYIEQARQQVLQSPSLIWQIETYNNHLQYLVTALAMRIDLGDTHRQGISIAMERFSQAFFGEGQSIVKAMREAIGERFLGETSATHIPEAWLCWPITAGGCGLLHATILAASYNTDFSQRIRMSPPEERADNWQYRYNAWASYYQSLTREISASKPTTNPVMETLVNDFIRRGSEVSNSNQEDLSPYWRWLLYIYGPQLLDALGSFRFLITELVPLQLIMKKYRQGTNSEGDEA